MFVCISAHFTRNPDDTTHDEGTDATESHVEICLPPPYDNLSGAPPLYGDSNVRVITRESGIILAPPSYTEAVNQEPPHYTPLDPLGTDNMQLANQSIHIPSTND